MVVDPDFVRVDYISRKLSDLKYPSMNFSKIVN